MYKNYHFLKPICRSLCTRYDFNVILELLLLIVLRPKSCYWLKVWIYLWNNPHKTFLVIKYLEGSWNQEKYETFCIRKCLHIFQLAVIDIGDILWAVCKYSFVLSLDSLFLLFVFFVASLKEAFSRYVVFTDLKRYEDAFER